MSESLYRDILDFVCLLLYCILMTIPIYDIYLVYKNKETNTYPYFYLLISSYNCLFWIIYGIKILSFALIWSSFYGTIVNIGCMIFFILATTQSSNIKHLLNCSFIFSFVLIITIELIFNIRASLYGLIACVLDVVVSISTVQKISDVLTFRDIRFIPIRLVTVFLVDNIAWILYSILLKDIFIAFPTLIAIICNSFQIYLYILFSATPRSSKMIDNISINIMSKLNDSKLKQSNNKSMIDKLSKDSYNTELLS
jgi:hypothetical protein